MQIASRISSWTSGETPTPPAADTTRFEVVTTSQYPTAGIYSATAIDSSTPIVVDWGDGSTDLVTGDISMLTHTYSAAGTYVVEISDNISSINLKNDNAYNNRYIITRVLNISSHVTSIPDNGFNYLQALYSVYAGGSGELTLGSYAFALAYGATSQVLGTFDFSGRTIAAIPQQCFYYRQNLDGFLFPQGLTSIGASAFADCFKLTSVNLSIPEGVTTWGANAFNNCTALAQITLPSTLTTIGVSNENGVFRNCTSLAEITLPAALTFIGGSCFQSCSNLGSIRSNATTAPSLGNYAWGRSGSYTGSNTASAGTNRLYVPNGATGYTSSTWASTLCESTRCGFTLEYV